MKINYQRIMEGETEKIKESGRKPSLLLHACCAPCSSAVLERLCDIFYVTLYFYNPNISPTEEFEFRLAELKRLVTEMGLDISVIVPKYDNGEFESVVKGMEDMAEGGARCAVCYRLRLERAVHYAEEHGFDYVTTTLSVSPYKNAALLNELGNELTQNLNVRHLTSDFKKKDGYKRSCELSAEYNLYRQNYCGCVYSKRAAEMKREKEQNNEFTKTEQ